MRTFLQMLMVLVAVSGDHEIIHGVLEDSVLLPCACSERNVDEELKWQIEEPKVMLVFKYNKTTSNFFGRYEGRAKVFLSEDGNNCSVLLANITAEDRGMYRCSFRRQETYQKSNVFLNISARYDVCQRADNLRGSVKVFHCGVKGRYGEAEIQWKVHGQLLRNSTTTNISRTYTLNASTGLYHFDSALSIELSGPSEPACHVKTKDISAIIHSDCGERTEQRGQTVYFRRYRYLTIIPIMSVLGISLLLWHRWDSRSLPRIREVETCNL